MVKNYISNEFSDFQAQFPYEIQNEHRELKFQLTDFYSQKVFHFFNGMFSLCGKRNGSNMEKTQVVLTTLEIKTTSSAIFARISSVNVSIGSLCQHTNFQIPYMQHRSWDV